MKVGFNLQSENITKHPLMPDNYPYHIYEVEDNFPEEDLLSQGYTFLPKSDFDAMVASFDLTAYNAAILAENGGPQLSELELKISNSIMSAEEKGEEIIAKFKRENVLLGITEVETVAIIKVCHWLEHFLESGSLKGAIVELDHLIQTVSPNLAPFVTIERLTSIKNEIQDYLNIPRT